MSCTLIFNTPTLFNKAEVDRIWNFMEQHGGYAGDYWYVAVVDCNTGMCLNYQNDCDIIVKVDHHGIILRTKLS